MSALLQSFQAFRQILCICPCCGEVVRVSDLHLRYRGKGKKTWLDEYEQKSTLLQKREETFLEAEAKLREKAVEKGRKEAEKIINGAISPKFRSLKLNPYDIKPVLHPIDFLVFKGMNSDEGIDNIVLLSRQSSGPIASLQKSVKTAVSCKKYEWQVLRVKDNGEICKEC